MDDAEELADAGRERAAAPGQDGVHGYEAVHVHAHPNFVTDRLE
ncbi:MAG TPA: hypothetical protein VF667_10395 [Pseudonocardia sp.]